MKHLAITVAVLLLALVSYGAGMERSSSLLVALGAAFEALFWVRALRKKPLLKGQG